MPLRGSSKRPRKPTVGPDGRSGRAGPCANRATSTPLGTSVASPPRCSTCTRRAIADTAIRAVTFSINGRSTPPNATSARERSVEVWNVATIGPWAASSASTEMLNVVGSCRCSTSNSRSASQRFTRA